MIRNHLIKLVALLLLVAIPQTAIFADTLAELRLSIGSKLFPSMLAADLHITQKQGSDGTLQLLVVYRQNPQLAELVSDKLATISDVRGIPLRITPISQLMLAESDVGVVAGIFVAEDLHSDLAQLLEFAGKHKVILFSPYEGDVERGAHGGVAVRDHILPYINITALKLADIQLKSFFLRVAEQYE